jgi:hypothetical protein
MGFTWDRGQRFIVIGGCMVSACIESRRGLDAHGERKYHQVNGEVTVRVIDTIVTAKT